MGRVAAGAGTEEEPTGPVIDLHPEADWEPGRWEARLQEIVAARGLLREVLDVTARLAAAPDRRTITSVLIEHGIAAFGADAGAVHLLADDRETLVMAASRGWPERETTEFQRFSLHDELPAALALRSRTTVAFSSPDELRHRYPSLAPTQDAVGDISWILVPIAAGTKHLGVLGLSFFARRALREGEREILETLAATAGQAIERAVAQEAIADFALELQRALLPASVPRHRPFDAAARYLPAPGRGEVGGDWYEVIDGPDDALFIIGDVAGHGATAAGTMAAARFGLAALARHERRPGELLRQVAEHVQFIGEARLVTCCVARLEYATGRLTWATAGHPPPLLADRSGAALLAADPGPPLGVVEDQHYQETGTVLDRGTDLVLYTDGLIERRGEHLDAGLERLQRAMAALPRGSGSELIVDGLVAALAGGADDDVALLTVRWNPKP